MESCRVGSPGTEGPVRTMALTPATLGKKEFTLLCFFAQRSDEDATRAEEALG